jgi:hypothetical protein
VAGLVARMEEIKRAQIWFQILKERAHLKELDIDVLIILKSILREAVGEFGLISSGF